MKTILIIVLPALVLAGCLSTRPGADPEPSPPSLARAEALFAQGRHTAAMIECVELARRDPLLPGLAELQTQIVAELTEERARAAALRSAMTGRRMAVDTDERRALPDTYGLRRPVRGLTGPLRTAPSRMQQVLDRKVTVHLDGVTLNDFILAIGASENVNIIADDALNDMENPPTLTLHAQDVPLSEILDYVSRNLGIQLYVGENILWVTPGTPAGPAVPMDTRMYRLRKGLSSEELETGDGRIKIIEAIERFVPQEDGADRLFDRKSHVLIVRDTPRNLARIEDLIETLDVCPPQILIEARFISAGTTNLRDIGIDWLLDSPISVTRRTVLHNNRPVSATESQIMPTENQPIESPETRFDFDGLSLAYQGVLTDPMFRAVVHALETSGNAQTLSVPKVTTVNNREARVWMGQRIPYFESTRIENYQVRDTNTGDWIYQTRFVPDRLQWLEPGYELLVTPSIGSDLQSINLKLVPEISELLRWEDFSGDMRVPVTAHRLIETEVMVLSGETVVMGGLVTSTESLSERGVPILSHIPLIGRLFRYDRRETAKENLLIFVTATIISERGETLIPVVGDE